MKIEITDIYENDAWFDCKRSLVGVTGSYEGSETGSERKAGYFYPEEDVEGLCNKGDLIVFHDFNFKQLRNN